MIFTAQYNAVAVTAQQDLFEINCPATGSIYLHEFGLFQTTEVGDAQEEMLRILLKTGATTSGLGGTTPTAVPRFLGATAFAGTVEVNNTTKATAGTIVTRQAWGWNVRMPLQNIWTPETRPRLAPSARMTIELATTPADSITMGGYVIFEVA